MPHRISSLLSQSLLGAVLSVCLAVACATTPGPAPKAPAPTLGTPTPFEPATTAPSHPALEPAAAPTSTSPTETTDIPPDGLPVSYDPGESELLAALESLPLEFAARGIWFSNLKQFLEVAGAPRPRDLEEFESLPEDQRTRFSGNAGGPVSSLLITMRQTMSDWEEAYGFSFFEVDTVTVTGMGNLMPFGTNHFTGELDEDTIVRKLADWATALSPGRARSTTPSGMTANRTCPSPTRPPVRRWGPPTASSSETTSWSYHPTPSPCSSS